LSQAALVGRGPKVVGRTLWGLSSSFLLLLLIPYLEYSSIAPSAAAQSIGWLSCPLLFPSSHQPCQRASLEGRDSSAPPVMLRFIFLWWSTQFVVLRIFQATRSVRSWQRQCCVQLRCNGRGRLAKISAVNTDVVIFILRMHGFHGHMWFHRQVEAFGRLPVLTRCSGCVYSGIPNQYKLDICRFTDVMLHQRASALLVALCGHAGLRGGTALGSAGTRRAFHQVLKYLR